MENRLYTTFKEMGTDLSLNKDDVKDDVELSDIFSCEVTVMDLRFLFLKVMKTFPNSENDVLQMEAWINNKEFAPPEFKVPENVIDKNGFLHYSVVYNLERKCKRLLMARYDAVLWLSVSMFETDGLHHLYIYYAKILLILSKMAYVLKRKYVKILMVRKMTCCVFIFIFN